MRSSEVKCNVTKCRYNEQAKTCKATLWQRIVVHVTDSV